MKDNGGSAADSVAALAVDERSPRTGEPLIRAEGVWKVFGPHGDRIVGSPDAELPRRRAAREDGLRRRPSATSPSRSGRARSSS